MNKATLFQPFFPFKAELSGESNLIYPGVSLFDFYASQAPRVPSDFEYERPPNCPIHPGTFDLRFGKGSSYKYSAYVLQYHFDDEWVGDYEQNVPLEVRTEMEADIAAWNERMKKYLLDDAAWQLRNKLEKHSQWAKAYATHMIAMREGMTKSRLWDLKEEDVEKLLKLMDTSATEIYSFPQPPFSEEDIVNAFNEGFYLGTDTDVYGEFIAKRDEYVTELKKKYEPTVIKIESYKDEPKG